MTSFLMEVSETAARETCVCLCVCVHVCVKGCEEEEEEEEEKARAQVCVCVLSVLGERWCVKASAARAV